MVVRTVAPVHPRPHRLPAEPSHPSRQWVRFAGEGGQGCGDFMDGGLDVGGGGCVVVGVGVAGVFAGDGVAEVAFDPGQVGVVRAGRTTNTGSTPGGDW